MSRHPIDIAGESFAFHDSWEQRFIVDWYVELRCDVNDITGGLVALAESLCQGESLPVA